MRQQKCSLKTTLRAKDDDHHVAKSPAAVIVPNETTRETYEEDFSEHEETSFGERFALVFEGANLTSAERIADLLDATVHDYWETVESDEDWANPANPCVYVEK